MTPNCWLEERNARDRRSSCIGIQAIGGLQDRPDGHAQGGGASEQRPWSLEDHSLPANDSKPRDARYRLATYLDKIIIFFLHIVMGNGGLWKVSAACGRCRRHQNILGEG